MFGPVVQVCQIKAGFLILLYVVYNVYNWVVWCYLICVFVCLMQLVNISEYRQVIACTKWWVALVNNRIRHHFCMTTDSRIISDRHDLLSTLRPSVVRGSPHSRIPIQ